MRDSCLWLGPPWLYLRFMTPILCFTVVFYFDLIVSLCWCIAYVKKPPCELSIYFCLTTAESRERFGLQKKNSTPSPPVSSAASRSKVMVPLLLIYCLLLLQLFVGYLCLVLILLCSPKYPFQCCNYLAKEERTGCIILLSCQPRVTVTSCFVYPC